MTKETTTRIASIFIVIGLLVQPPEIFAKESAPATKVLAKLVMPNVHYSVPGVEMEIIFTHAVLSKVAGNYKYTAKCNLGTILDDRLKLKPGDDAVGDHMLTVKLLDSNGKQIDEASTTIRVVPKEAGDGKEISLLIMGDSLTQGSRYPNEVASLLSQPDNPKWKMWGVHHPPRAKENVFHEGYSGWTWNRFNTSWDPKVTKIGKKHSSPFLSLGKDNKPFLDIGGYLAKNCGGKAPDYLTVLLGINDCFHPDPDDPKAVEDRISLMLSEADKFLKAFQKDAPYTEIGICLVPAANSRDAAFDANYKGHYTRWGWRRIQYRLVERQIEHFGGRERKNIFVIPTSLIVDSTLGYEDNNGVHPNEYGNQQLGSQIYAWMKWRMKVNNSGGPGNL